MKIQELLKSMTLEQKLAQMSQFNANFLFRDAGGEITGPAKELALTESELASVGSVLNFNGAANMKKIQDVHMEQDPLKIPLLFMQDVIHGYRTIYPIPLGMGATWDPDLMEECCRMAAKEAAIAGVQVTFGPMVDLARDCRWGRNMETTSEDPYLNCEFSKAQVKGFQGNMKGKYDVAACVKHFAAYGAAEAGRDYNTVDMSEHTLREYYLPAYKAAIDANVEMLMTSFNTINGVPSSGNKWLVDGVLRKEWGFDGIVISDYNAFREMKKHGFCEDDKECADYALNAGTDIEMMSNCYIKQIPALLQEGKVTMEQIDKSVLRILQLKEKMGLFDNPYGAASEEAEKKYNLCKKHRETARKAAEEAAVLLKNDGVLPFSEDIKSVAVVGPFAEKGMIGFWSCSGKEDEAVSVKEGIKKLFKGKGVTVRSVLACEGDAIEEPNKAEIARAVRIAKSSDVVVVCAGEKREHAGEGNSKADVSLSKAQKELIKAVSAVNDKVAVVLFNGRPLVLTDCIDTAPAFMTIWQPGTEGGSAVANLLWGKVNFEGKLPMTFPYCVGQAPIYYNSMRTGRPKDDENYKGGYISRYLDAPNLPLFPFGYGLSYTTFEVSPTALSKSEMVRGETITASVTVKNTGAVAGKTVLQLYIRDKVASLVRPVKELKGFQKIELQAGEEKVVSFAVSEEQLKFFSASGEYKAENGEFTVCISDSSAFSNPVSFYLK